MTLLAKPEKKQIAGFDWRVRLIALGLLIAGGILVARLAHLQIVQGDQYAVQAKENRIHSILLRAQRGTIYGRGGTVLASNRAAYDLFLVPKECQGYEEDICARLEHLVGTDADALMGEIEEHRHEPYTQIEVKRDITRTELSRVEEMAYCLPGVGTLVRPQRRYHYGRVGGQLMGWLNEIGRAELDEMPKYRRGDLIGRAGLEMAYEDTLKGTHGRMVVTRYNLGMPQIRTDAYGNLRMVSDQRGRRVVVEDRNDPISGRPIHVSLDIALQAKAEEILGTERGAIVVLNAETGEVLALASMPGYDPNTFVDADQQHEKRAVAALLSNKDHLKRMRHRAFQEHYAPGSVFKVMMATAALEEGVITRDTTFFCPGHFSLGNTTWRCWKRGGHGNIAVVDALAYSCDVFFYNVGLELGVERIDAWAEKMGLGTTTGIDLPREDKGLVPSPAWKNVEYAHLNPWDRAWQPGETVNLSIGQGQCALTPLQTAVMMSCIVNGGKRVRPYLDMDLSPQLSEPFISPETIATVREGMRKCVAKHDFPSGTGRRADIEGLFVIGKTGTAQVVSRSAYAGYDDELDIPYNLRDHAWFVAGVLDAEPPIAVAVLFEHGLHGSSGAAPMAGEIIDFFYNKRVTDSIYVADAAEGDE